MSRGQYPVLLMLAISMSRVAYPLGLGDIHVNSALNQPLSAQIDIVGATPEDLADIRASIASREIFQRYGADRPAFLTTAKFKVAHDVQGRPVLDIRSDDAFTDPLVSLLVDLRWRTSSVVREYPLLLDPEGLRSTIAAAQFAAENAPTATDAATTADTTRAAVQVAAPLALPRDVVSEPTRSTPALQAASVVMTHHRITRRDTLRGIARRSGARSESQVVRMMTAIYRANPAGFDGNLNRLHRGVVLTIPNKAEVDAISLADASREVHSQMAAWREKSGMPSLTVAATRTPLPTARAVTDAPAVTAASSATSQAAVAAAAESDALKSRVLSLEQTLNDLKRSLAGATVKTQHSAEPPASAPQLEPTPVATPHAAQPTVQQDDVDVLDGNETLDAIPAPVEAETPNVAAPRSYRRWVRQTAWGAALALALGTLYAWFRWRQYKEAARPRYELAPDANALMASILDEKLPTSGYAAPAVPQANASAKPNATASASTADNPKRALPRTEAIEATPIHMNTTDTASNLDIDIDALENSYLDTITEESSLHSVALQSLEDELTAELEREAAMHADTASTAKLVPLTETEPTEELPQITAADFALCSKPKQDAAVLHSTKLDYNLLDLDTTAQHVQMPSMLSERAEIAESRANIVDVLRLAIAKDPHRRDLKLKLLEVYYNAAATNRLAFLEVARKFAGERDSVSAADWDKVLIMGRQIASDDALFADRLKSDDEEIKNYAA